MLMGGFWAAREGRELEAVTFSSFQYLRVLSCCVSCFWQHFERGVVGHLEAVNIVTDCSCGRTQLYITMWY
jgi:hypothetical protein